MYRVQQIIPIFSDATILFFLAPGEALETVAAMGLDPVQHRLPFYCNTVHLSTRTAAA
jgi:hypothetical protein